MHFKAIVCQVFTREMESVLARSHHAIDVENVPMGLHDLGVEMRPHLQERIDAADNGGYDAILSGVRALRTRHRRPARRARRNWFFRACMTALAC
jgi:hypothetical protein